MLASHRVGRYANKSGTLDRGESARAAVGPNSQWPKQGRRAPARSGFPPGGESMKHARLLQAAVGSLSVAAFLAANSGAIADEMGALIEAAKKEGELTIIAVPHDWCGYAGIINDFKAKYPFLKLNELDPDAGSGDEIEAIKANKGNKGPQAPDVIDVGLSFGPSSKAEGLLQPYKVSTWDSI